MREKGRELHPVFSQCSYSRVCVHEGSTWVLGFSSKQSQRQTSLDVLVAVDGGTNAGKDLTERESDYSSTVCIWLSVSACV